jgi:hypothetical protein
LLGGLLLAGDRIGGATFLTVMRVFAIFGFIIIHSLLILFFYLLVTPLGGLLRLMGKDLIDARGKSMPQWKIYPRPVPERRRYYRLF